MARNITNKIDLPKAWDWSEKLQPWQQDALFDFRFGNYLEFGKDPTTPLTQFTQAPKLKYFLGAITISGAVGIGKSTLLNKVLEELDGFAPFPTLSPAIRMYYNREAKRIIVLAEDFSVYIESRLRDIPPSSHIHAQFFYAQIYKAIVAASQIIDCPWLLIWDRYPIENLAFAQEPLDPAALFRDFWPTRIAFDGLHSLMPKVAVFPYWAIKHPGMPFYMVDYSKRSEFVQKRNRCELEVNTRFDKQDWFYKSAIRLYKEIGVECVGIDLNDENCVKFLADDFRAMLQIWE